MRKRFIKAAIEEAKKSKYIYRLGAIALKDNQIVAKGHNKLANHSYLQRRYGYHSVHAEAAVVLRAKHYNADTIIVVRVLKDSSLTCSFPCKKCQKMMKDFGIKKVIYIDWNSKMQELRL